jgi:hypothetical protein
MTIPEIPEWAKERVSALTVEERDKTGFAGSVRRAFERYVAEHEDPPVDPILVAAREIVSTTFNFPATKKALFDGKLDHWTSVKLTEAGIRRGLAMAKEEGDVRRT